ncbi:hypothetical protein K458DRAFT_391288 [Lentithecium fluviatile CBS 122367]|uniref:Uncharacterized protein n=1 Tax=Lentithecium fluviatile CBS 122367 TaxID=1168545 RepID=A0A6G1IWC2_9PLEO|nr:hypothetical protein K458DRAFT_391288 [Lentithecium fluviatile CBS 122367]
MSQLESSKTEILKPSMIPIRKGTKKLHERVKRVNEIRAAYEIMEAASKAQGKATKALEERLEMFDFDLVEAKTDLKQTMKVNVALSGDLEAAEKIAEKHKGCDAKTNAQDDALKKLVDGMTMAKNELHGQRSLIKEHDSRKEELRRRIDSEISEKMQLASQLKDLHKQLHAEIGARESVENRLKVCEAATAHLKEALTSVHRHYNHAKESDERWRNEAEKRNHSLVQLTARVRKETEQSDALRELASEQQRKVQELQNHIEEEKSANRKLR